MRLTLRNLLRFLDQTDMRAVERNRLESLVAESKKATQWIEKIKRVKGQSELRSLAIDDPDYSVDQIAAYLDSKLGEETTVDLERSILSRNELLAEIASCHAIRESNSNAPNITIPLELRQAIYDLRLKPKTFEGIQPVANSDSTSSANRRMEDLPFVDAESDSQAPEILAANSSDPKIASPVSIDAMYKKAKRRSQIVAALIGIVLIAFLAFAFELGRQSGKDQQTASAQPDAKKSPNADKQPGDPSDAQPENSQAKNADASDKPDRDDQPNTDFGDTPGSHPHPPIPVSTENEDPDTTKTGDSELSQRPIIEFTPKSEAIPDRQRQPVATVKNEDSILLKRAEDSIQWVRADTDTPILENTELMVLAGTDAQLDLRGNLTVKIEGPARFTIGMNDIASDTEVLIVSHGVFQVEANVADIDLLWVRSDRRYRTTLPITPAIATVEFMQYQLPGLDSRSAAPAQIDLFSAPMGRVIVKEGESTWRLSESMVMARVVSANADLALDPTIGSIDQPLPKGRDYTVRLKDTVEKNFSQVRSDLPSNQTLYEFLVKLKGDSKQERRFAAISWLAASGEFAFLLDFLNDEKNRNNWRSAIEAVQAAIINHPEYADKLQSYLLENDPQDGSKIYEMITGFSQKQLADGGDAQLVEALDSDSLATRVLAIETLRQITGGRSYGYSANADRKSRRRSIDRQWNKLLGREELRYEAMPTLPVPELLPLQQPPEEAGTPLEDAVNDGD